MFRKYFQSNCQYANYDMLITKHGILEEFPFNMLEEAPDYDFVGSWEAQWELTKAQIADSWNRRGLYNYLCIQFLLPLTLWVRIPLRRGVLDSTLCENVCQWLAAGRWFSPGTPVSSTNKTDHNDITWILLKVVLNNLTITKCIQLLQHNNNIRLA